MLKKIRVLLAVFFMASITLLFLDYTGSVHAYIGWSARVQLVPAILAVNAAVFIGLILITALFGRLYCSTICPLGLFQDAVSRIAGIRKKNRFSYRPPRRAAAVLRFALLGIFALAVIVPVSAIPVLLEPYSAYGRIASEIFGPLYQLGNNVLAWLAERAESYAFYSVDVWLRSMGVFAAAVLTVLVVGIFAWRSGRGYCNSVCPVGAFLGFLAQYSLVKLRIDKEKCTACGACARVCKAACIDTSGKEIDYLRCVACFNCMGSCPQKALTYSTPAIMKGAHTMKTSEPHLREKADALPKDGAARRGILAGIAFFTLGFVTRAAARVYEFDGGLAPLQKKKAPLRASPILPPGADTLRNFQKSCTGCQLCVSVCQNQVLRSSIGAPLFMQPSLSFERGYCRPECVRCSGVCPNGALRPVTPAEKSATQIGYAVWIKDNCVVNTDNVACDLCERKCPTGAITRIPQRAGDPSSPKIPMIDTNRCIGCGACENLCPARPYSALYVEGIDTHRTI